MASVELRNVSKRYPNGVTAVDQASLHVRDGEFVVLVGPSGCGKTSTLRMIAGLEEVSGGEVLIGGRVVNGVEPKDRDIAMVFQNYALYPHMTVYKNMAFGLKIRKYPRKEIKARVGGAARVLGIEDLLDRKPRALSGGQRQRVAVGRAIVRQPQVFLFDEPLSNLDAMLRVQMRAELGKLHSRLRTTMIYVTHDQVEAMTMGDRIVVMLDGRIQQIATPTVLYSNPVNRFVAGFIGSPPMNFRAGHLAGASEGLYFRDDSRVFDLQVADAHEHALREYVGTDVVLGIRPEHLQRNVRQEAERGRSITTSVEVVEPLGAETFVYLTAGGAPLIARLHSEALPEVGSHYIVDAAMEKAHFFDAQTGEVIGRTQAAPEGAVT